MKHKRTLFVSLLVPLSACQEDKALRSCKDVMENCILDKAIQLPPGPEGMRQAEQYCRAQNVPCRK